MEPISPELCLVDPVLARRARELLPSLEEAGPADRLAPAAPVPAQRAARGRLARLGGWLLAASLVLNVVLLWPKSTSETAPVSSPTPAPKAARAPAKHPTAKHPTPKRAGGVLAAKAKQDAVDTAPRVTTTSRIPREQRTLTWPATARASSYDLVLWRDHRRVADLFPKRPGIAVSKVACGAGRRLKKGRYLWFVYPVVGRSGSHRYGALARWGTVDVDPKGCPRT